LFFTVLILQQKERQNGETSECLKLLRNVGMTYFGGSMLVPL